MGTLKRTPSAQPRSRGSRLSGRERRKTPPNQPAFRVERTPYLAEPSVPGDSTEGARPIKRARKRKLRRLMGR